MEQCPTCGCKHYEKYGFFHEEGYLVEYSVRCECCGTKIGTWAYGSWFLNDNYVEGRERNEAV